MIIVLLGPPGAGKGTVAECLMKKGFRTFSVGEALRKEVRSGSELGKKVKEYLDRGELVPADIVNRIVLSHLEDNMVLDGYPRSMEQAKALETVDLPVKIVFLDVPDEVIVERMKYRYVCPRCGTPYNLKTKPPKNDLKCDYCGVRLIRRKDDEPEVVRERLRVYREETEPVMKYYREKGVLIEVDGVGSPEEVCNQVMRVLGIS